MKSTLRLAQCRLLLPLIVVAGLVASACATDVSVEESEENELKAGAPFVDSLDRLPAAYLADPKAIKFKLSQNYPKTRPTTNPASFPWAKIDFKTDPDAYMLAVRRYVFAGLGIWKADGSTNPAWPNHFNDVGAKGWYGVPWLHVGLAPREGIHGLTRERDASKFQLAPTQTIAVQNWGVGFYNDLDGYTLGRVWTSGAAKPPVAASNFLYGSVVVKFLFTAATPEQVPWLKNTYSWKGNINATMARDFAHVIKDVNLAQVDIAVKDARAGKSQWIFGTYAYDPNVPAGAAQGESAWHRMMPVGVAWGNDENVSVASTGPLSETVVAKGCPTMARNTFGVGGRLNGPADNPASSCMSCHATAQFQSNVALPLDGMVAPRGATAAQVQKWFRTIAGGNEPAKTAPGAFTAGQTGLDYSLQQMMALQNFYKTIAVSAP